MSIRIRRRAPSAITFEHGPDGDVTELLALLKTLPTAAQTVTAMSLDVYTGVPARAVADILRCCPNLERLRLICQRGDLAEALFSSLAPMPNLRTFHLALSGFAHTYSLVEWLVLMPNLRVLRLDGEFETNPQLRESFIEQARETGALRHVRSYERHSAAHYQHHPTFVGPMPALQSARISVKRANADVFAELGDSQPVHLFLGCRPQPSHDGYMLPFDMVVSASVLAGMQACRRLRHLDIEYLSNRDLVFEALRALGPQIQTLGFKCWESRIDTVATLAAGLAQCVGERLPALRALRLELIGLSPGGEMLIQSRVTPLCRKRRVRFTLSTPRL